MKIGIISDTHDHVEGFAQAAILLRRHAVELVVHCGDWVAPYTVVAFGRAVQAVLPNVPIRGVFGNNDGDRVRINEQIRGEKLDIQIASDILELPAGKGKPIAVYHGTEEKIVNALIGYGQYKAVFRGHTHIPAVRGHQIGSGENVLEVNPGTTSSFSGGRIVDKASVAVYDSETNTAELLFF